MGGFWGGGGGLFIVVLYVVLSLVSMSVAPPPPHFEPAVSALDDAQQHYADVIYRVARLDETVTQNGMIEDLRLVQEMGQYKSDVQRQPASVEQCKSEAPCRPASQGQPIV